MRRILLIILICLTVSVSVVQAQETPSLSTLEISLWPEFDRPEVLVIYRGLFEDGTALPVPVEIRIPAKVGQPTAVAYVGEDGQRFNQQYTTQNDGDWLVVSFELGELGFQLEYYDALAIDSAGQRQYTYSYTADYPIVSLTMEAQEPPSAEAISLDPPADSSTTASDGLVYHAREVGTLEQGEEQSWSLAYQKNNDDLTISAFSQAESTAPTPAPASGDDSTVLIFLVAFVTLIAVGAAAFWLGGRTQPMSQPALPGSQGRKRRGSGRGGQAQRQPLSKSDGGDAFYCRQCGTKLRSDSLFCHRCGTPVKTE
jgi:hypothetical protein